MDDDNALKTLAFGNAVVDAGSTFDGSLPPAHPLSAPSLAGRLLPSLSSTIVPARRVAGLSMRSFDLHNSRPCGVGSFR